MKPLSKAPALDLQNALLLMEHGIPVHFPGYEPSIPSRKAVERALAVKVCRLGPLTIFAPKDRGMPFYVVDLAWSEIVAECRSAREAYKIASQVVRSLNRSMREDGELRAGWDATP